MAEECVPYARRRYLEIYAKGVDVSKLEPGENYIVETISRVIRGWGSTVYSKAVSDDWWIFDHPVNLRARLTTASVADSSK